MSKYAVPEEIRKMKPKGTMVKAIHGKYYVYEYFNRKNDEGKWATKMGKMIGYIDEKNGFVPNNNRMMEQSVTSLEYGQYALAINNSQDTLNRLLSVFNPEDALRIYIVAIIHFVNGFVCLKNIHHYYDQSHMSLVYPNLKFSYKSIVPLIDALGRRQEKVHEFEQNLIDDSSKEMAIDGHVMRSCSHENDLAANGNKFKLLKDMQINVLMGYDINTHKPLLSRIYEGGSLDKSSIQDLLTIHSYKDMLFIIDRGFYSEKNIELFSQNGNRYIIPLSMNLKSYKEATKDMNLDKAFVYEKSKKRTVIEYKEVIKDEKTKIIIYRDNNQSMIDKADYLKNLEMGKGDYSKEGYDKVKDFFGVIVLETNCLDKTAEEIYCYYKKRWSIETFYNYFKNDVNIEALHVEDYYKTQGLSFIMLIVGLIHSEFKTNMKDVKGKSINDVLLEARFVKVHKRSNHWGITNIKKELQTMMELLNIDFTKEIDNLN